MRQSLFVFAMLAAASIATSAPAEEPVLLFPLIKGYGGIAALPDAAEPPRRGAKMVFDIAADSKPEEVHRGLESVARYLNLNAQAGHAASDIKLAVVLHGGATKCALNDEAYARVTKAAANPNLALLRELRKHGVELFVCGQSLARHQYAQKDVAPEIAVAVSAMTVNVNKQLAGYAYLSLH
jgi:intracellular sulfur oxidation DsrE/DsrF family protein